MSFPEYLSSCSWVTIRSKTKKATKFCFIKVKRTFHFALDDCELNYETLLKKSTPKNTIISPNFLVWKFSGKTPGN